MTDQSQINNPHWKGLKFDPKTTEYAMFEGIETEGPFKGNKTLFIIGSVPASQVLAYAYEHNIKYFYFDSVGVNFDIDEMLVEDIARSSPIYIKKGITIATTKLANWRKLWSLSLKPIWLVVPYIWHGQLIQQGLDLIKQVISADIAYSVLGKIDTGSEVILHNLDDFYHNKYSEGYSEDKLILHKER